MFHHHLEEVDKSSDSLGFFLRVKRNHCRRLEVVEVLLVVGGVWSPLGEVVLGDVTSEGEGEGTSVLRVSDCGGACTIGTPGKSISGGVVREEGGLVSGGLTEVECGVDGLNGDWGSEEEGLLYEGREKLRTGEVGLGGEALMWGVPYELVVEAMTNLGAYREKGAWVSKTCSSLKDSRKCITYQARIVGLSASRLRTLAGAGSRFERILLSRT